jgi:hypothetical protein
VNVNTVSDSTSEEVKKGDGYERPDHSRYRPSWEYTEEDDNSIIDDAKARQAAQKNEQLVSDKDNGDPTSMIPPPPPPPPPRPNSMLNHPSFRDQANNISPGPMIGAGNIHPNIPNSEEDWVGDESGRSDCSMLFGSNAQDWDQSLSVIPTKRYPDLPKLDAPGSHDSQEENKPQRASLYSPNGPTGEVGTELKLKSPSPRRRSFFTRGRGHDKRQSLSGRVQVFEDDKVSETTSKASQRSFLGLRNRSRSPGRRRIFGRSKSGNDVTTASSYGSVAEDVDKQSFIGAYRDSMSQVDQSMSYPVFSLHPAYPLNNGMSMMSKDDAMERQSFITAYRESMEPGDSKVNSITERLRRIRAQKLGSGLADLVEEVDDEAFERQSMITAHRESFEGKGHSMMQNHNLHPKNSTQEERQEGYLCAAQKESMKMNRQGNETSWEQRTREALERIRCGADENSTLPSPRTEKTEDETVGDEKNKTSENEETEESNQNSNTSKNSDGVDSTDKVDEVSPTAEKLSTMLSCTSISSNEPKSTANLAAATTTPPLKSILKSPGSGKRVSFGADQERIFHDEQNENQVTPPPPPPSQPKKTGSLFGNMLGQRNQKSVSPSPKQQGLGGVHSQGAGSNPLPNQSPGQPSPIQGQLPYMYPPYLYPQMMPTTSPINSDQIRSPSFASDSSMPQAQMPYGWPLPPVPSGDSSQQQSAMPLPPYMAAPPYYYGYPPNYGGYMYPPAPVMQNKEEKKKKKRVFRGRKLLSAVVRKGGGGRQSEQSDTVTALGSSTLSSSYSAEGPGDGHSVEHESPVKV